MRKRSRPSRLRLLVLAAGGADLLAVAHVITVSKAERAAGAPLPSTSAAASAQLQKDGFVVLTAPGGLLPTKLVSDADDSSRHELSNILSRVKAVGIDPHVDSFSFEEIAHRSRKRYDLQLDLRRSAASETWEQMSQCSATWALHILRTLPWMSAPEPAVQAGLITSLDGAGPQLFHADGSHLGVYSVFVPLVDVARGTGTDFWPGSHVDSSLAALAPKDGKLCDALERRVADMEADGLGHVVQPSLRAGDMLLYDYRVVHRGGANPEGGAPRPIFYSTWADASAEGGDTNFLYRRSLADLESRQRQLGGLLF